MTPRLSITTDLVSQHSDLSEEVQAFAQAGFTHIHWCQNWAGEPVLYDADFIAATLARLRTSGIAIADIHGYSGTGGKLPYTDELFLAINRNRLDFAAATGAGVLVLHLPLRETGCMAGDLDHSRRMIESLLPDCRRAGVVPAIENLRANREFLQTLLEAFGPSALGFCYDSGHAHLHKVPDLVKAFSHRLVATHLHDNDGTADQHRLPGEGRCDWGMIARTLRECGYQGTWNLEVHARKDMPLKDFCQLAHQTLQRLADASA